MELFNANSIYKEFQYPASYLKAVKLNLVFASAGYEQRIEYNDFWAWIPNK